MSILLAILGLALLIVVHEGGHFLAARLCGMRVERFSIGFGKPLVAVKRGDTIYQIAPIPLGGFVQITGLNPHEEFDHDDPYVYPNRPSWMRFAVLAAGPAANYVTAVILAVAMFIGFGKIVAGVGEVLPDTPAAASGLKAGDALMEANGKALDQTTNISDVVSASKGQPVTLKIRRDGQIKELVITPEMNKEAGVYRIGIVTGPAFSPVPVGQAVQEALALPVVLTGQMLSGMWDMIVGKQPANLSGPVGIARVMANAAEQGAVYFLRLLMLLSIYLGLFNLLPLPGLDGGRILFVGINSLPIKQVSAKTEAAVHMVGILLLLGVFVLVTFNDIKQIVVRMIN